MPATTVLFYRDGPGQAVPAKEWLEALRLSNQETYAKCVVRIELLEAKGNQMRRPHADFLRDGIYELRIRVGKINYRLLYFFSGSNVAHLSHGLTKERTIPDSDIKLAIARKKAVEANPERHTYPEKTH